MPWRPRGPGTLARPCNWGLVVGNRGTTIDFPATGGKWQSRKARGTGRIASNETDGERHEKRPAAASKGLSSEVVQTGSGCTFVVKA